MSAKCFILVWHNRCLGQIGLFLETFVIPLMKTLRRVVCFPDWGCMVIKMTYKELRLGHSPPLHYLELRSGL